MNDEQTKRLDKTPAVREWVRASREAQGLPPTVTDPAALARIAAILMEAS